jgi:queuine tRNA-ribosyltransferase
MSQETRREAAEAPFHFTLEARSGAARAGRFTTPHGAFETPAFMPVGTHGAVKALTPEQVRATGAQIVLSNTYHLALRPGEALVEKLGGLHAFMRWSGPILTDSGGFQVFSLPKVTIDDRGARFANEVTGESVDLTPERAIEIQNALGADIIMAFDECTPFPATALQAATGVRRTLQWIERCMAAHARQADQALFPIVQGGVHLELRSRCAEALVALDLPGYAIGGVSVGEGHELMCRVTSHTAPLLPEHKPRYLMGVGLPEDILAAIGFGIDMFDCVIPTRYARSATVFTSRGRLRLTNRRYRRDAYPIDLSCSCAACRGGFSRAYLHHLFAANEVLSAVLCSIHNVHFYQALVRGAREAVKAGRYDEYRRAFLAEYGATPGDAASDEPREGAADEAAEQASGASRRTRAPRKPDARRKRPRGKR